MGFTPRGNDNVMIVTYSLNGFAVETQLAGSRQLPRDALTHVAVVANAEQSTLSLYLDGVLDAETPLRINLAAINDENDWLGISQYQSDPNLDAEFTELWIYGEALGPEALEQNSAAGPDVLIVP